MANCSTCGDQTSMPFTCKFCEQSFCSRHRLPENHDCTGLENYKKQSHEEGKIGYDVIKEDMHRKPEVTTQSRNIPRLAGILPGRLPISITYATIGIMFAAFILQGTVPGMFQTFALYPGAVLQDFEVWRLLTSMFLHASMAHLLVNSIVLLSFGPDTERMLGWEKFLEVLLVAGIASSIGFTLSGSLFGMGPAVGISGALYGLVTLLAVLRPDIRVLAFFFIPLKIRTAIMFFATMDIVNVIAHAVGVTLPVIGGFASTGHLSGLLVGLVYGYMLRDRYRGRLPGNIVPPGFQVGRRY